MLYAGLDLSRKRLDFHLLDAEGQSDGRASRLVFVTDSPRERDGSGDAAADGREVPMMLWNRTRKVVTWWWSPS
jgi:hypothetical protein